MEGEPKSKLKLARVEHRIAKYACRWWHYSRTAPANARWWGVWEDQRFIGVVGFGYGANSMIGQYFGAPPNQVRELVRVALTTHRSPVTQIVAIVIRLLKREMPRVRVLVSYADMAQRHIGTIYQASNWIYLGESRTASVYIVAGKPGRLVHNRTATDLRRRHNVKRVAGSIKHRYALGLDKEMRAQLEARALPYPVACEVVR